MWSLSTIFTVIGCHLVLFSIMDVSFGHLHKRPVLIPAYAPSYVQPLYTHRNANADSNDNANKNLNANANINVNVGSNYNGQSLNNAEGLNLISGMMGRRSLSNLDASSNANTNANKNLNANVNANVNGNSNANSQAILAALGMGSIQPIAPYRGAHADGLAAAGANYGRASYQPVRLYAPNYAYAHGQASAGGSCL